MAVIAIAPARVITIAITTANLGRSMKMLENIRCSVSRRDARGNNLARTDLLNTFDNYHFALFQPLRNNNIAPCSAPVVTRRCSTFFASSTTKT